jgi:branched-chain amino acid transport system ATP-binding protein
MNLLETDNLTRAYGGVIAVNEVSFVANKGMITGLIGPNGAGKSTLFNNMTGLDTPTSGKVFFEGKDITGMNSHKLSRMGMSRTFQNIRLFQEMSVVENVMIGRHYMTGNPDHKSNRLKNVFNSYFNMKQEEEIMYDNAIKLLDFFGIADLSQELAKNLPYGHQRELEIARALASEPKILFLDEPAAGMNPQETEHLMATIRKIRDTGVSVVLIEHDMKLVMNICDNITVLNYGLQIAQGTPHEISNNPLVIEAYLGKDED